MLGIGTLRTGVVRRMDSSVRGLTIDISVLVHIESAAGVFYYPDGLFKVRRAGHAE